MERGPTFASSMNSTDKFGENTVQINPMAMTGGENIMNIQAATHSKQTSELVNTVSLRTFTEKEKTQESRFVNKEVRE